MKTFTLIAALLFAPAAFAGDAQKTPTTKSGSAMDSSRTGDASKTGDTSKSAKPAKLNQGELQVLAHYHAVNQMEIDMGKTAKRLGKSEGVKEYGAMLIKDHTDTDKQLTALAKKHGQIIPMEKPATDTEKQEKADAKQAAMKLKKLKGADFDTAFLTQMVADHEKELAKVDAKASEVQDTELADMIRSIKPALQMHADHARQLQSGTMQTSMNTSGSTTSTPSGSMKSGSSSTSTPSSTSTKAGSSSTGSTTTTKKTGTSN